jgi:hypothetical protein
LSDLVIKHFLDDKTKIKYLTNFRQSTNYLVSDNIFYNYSINDKNNFFYFFKNKLFLNFLFKLSNKEILKLKYNNYIYLFDDFSLLNKNYYIFMNKYN